MAIFKYNILFFKRLKNISNYLFNFFHFCLNIFSNLSV